MIPGRTGYRARRTAARVKWPNGQSNMGPKLPERGLEAGSQTSLEVVRHTRFMSPGSTSSTAPTPGSQAVTGLVSALQWYDEQARSNRLSYQSLRLFAITLAAAIPVLTTSGAPALATAIVGSTIVVAEGTQQVFRFHDRYIGFRSAWNALDREKRLYASRSGRYANNSAPEQTLAERVDEVLAEETARWATSTARSREVNV